MPTNETAPIARGRSFVHEVIVELKKTTWPTPKESWRLTTVVILVVIAVAIYIGVIDYALTAITRHFGLLK
ncbi:MAG: preprotein translocase subunit SecE [Chthonomonadales bacterium]|nr:preprotein translocase subunit SecE [Chthonomonadales bacterium]